MIVFPNVAQYNITSQDHGDATKPSLLHVDVLVVISFIACEWQTGTEREKQIKLITQGCHFFLIIWKTHLPQNTFQIKLYLLFCYQEWFIHFLLCPSYSLNQWLFLCSFFFPLNRCSFHYEPFRNASSANYNSLSETGTATFFLDLQFRTKNRLKVNTLGNSLKSRQVASV